MKLPPAFSIETGYLPRRQAGYLKGAVTRYLKELGFGYSVKEYGRYSRARANGYSVSAELKYGGDKKWGGNGKYKVVLTAVKKVP